MPVVTASGVITGDVLSWLGGWMCYGRPRVVIERDDSHVHSSRFWWGAARLYFGTGTVYDSKQT